MRFLVVFLGLVCAFAHGAPSVENVLSPHPAYVKDIEILPSTDTKIVSGQNAERDQFPYQVSLEWGFISASSHICGGSIIRASAVLTAAHCIMGYGSYTLVAGILNRDESTSSTQSRSASNIILHENWPGGSSVAPWDIAIINVASPFILTPSVQVVPLPSQGASASGISVLSGWGRTSSIISTLPTTLQFAEKELLTNAECAADLISVLGSSGVLDETQICSSGRQRVSACSGDSGGPLVSNGLLVGVVSWGITPCGSTIAPSVYTRVASYVNWINGHL